MDLLSIILTVAHIGIESVGRGSLARPDQQQIHQGPLVTFGVYWGLSGLLAVSKPREPNI